MDTKPPIQLAEERHAMAMEYARLSEQLGNIVPYKATEWLKLRENSRSIAEADRKWELSEMGIEENQILLRMKALEKLISSMKGLQDATQNELNNASL